MNKLIGLTGGIAAGKSSVAAMFSELGALILSADKISHTILHDMWEIRKEDFPNIIGIPISELSDPEGSLNHQKLGKFVFSDKEIRRRLERELHPLVAEMSMRVNYSNL